MLHRVPDGRVHDEPVAVAGVRSGALGGGGSRSGEALGGSVEGCSRKAPKAVASCSRLRLFIDVLAITGEIGCNGQRDRKESSSEGSGIHSTLLPDMLLNSKNGDLGKSSMKHSCKILDVEGRLIDGNWDRREGIIKVS